MNTRLERLALNKGLKLAFSLSGPKSPTPESLIWQDFQNNLPSRVATEMVAHEMDPLLARQITRHKSEKSFERYSQRSLQKQA